jgi:hypothetical protein
MSSALQQLPQINVALKQMRLEAYVLFMEKKREQGEDKEGNNKQQQQQQQQQQQGKQHHHHQLLTELLRIHVKSSLRKKQGFVKHLQQLRQQRQQQLRVEKKLKLKVTNKDSGQSICERYPILEDCDADN